jgi:hypothetical protein
MKKTAFYFLSIALLIIFGVAGDMIVGRFNNIAEARDIARQFRAEAALLRFSTKNIVPNVNQIFVDTSFELTVMKLLLGVIELCQMLRKSSFWGGPQQNAMRYQSHFVFLRSLRAF